MIENDSNAYRLSEFAEKINVSTKELNRWDKAGILIADRKPCNRRIYTDNHVSQYKDLLENNPLLLSRLKNFQYKDLTGEVFGMLTVSHRVEDFIGGNGHRHIQWLCECSCGGSRIVKGASIAAGYNKSCGCSQYGDGDTKRMWSEFKAMKADDSLVPVKDSPKKVGRRRKDLVGQAFGWLTPLRHGSDIVPTTGRKIPTWYCECRCGAKLDVKTTSLTSGSELSCGCMPAALRKELANSKSKRSRKRKPDAGATSRMDITNETFGFWTALEPAETKVYASGGRATRWLCECSCGNQKVVPTRDLRSGASQSCGCMTSTSWLEHYVLKHLKASGIRFDFQKKYSDLLGTGGKQLSYDFLIYDDKGSPMMAIECQGEQHYRPIKRFGGAAKLLEQQIHDKLKREYAEDVLGIPLNEILYTCMTEDDVRSKLKLFNL